MCVCVCVFFGEFWYEGEAGSVVEVFEGFLGER